MCLLHACASRECDEYGLYDVCVYMPRYVFCLVPFGESGNAAGYVYLKYRMLLYFFGIMCEK